MRGSTADNDSNSSVSSLFNFKLRNVVNVCLHFPLGLFNQHQENVSQTAFPMHEKDDFLRSLPDKTNFCTNFLPRLEAEFILFLFSYLELLKNVFQ